MTELRAKAIKELENVPEEHVVEVIDFMAKLQEKEKESLIKYIRNYIRYSKKLKKKVFMVMIIATEKC